LERYEAIALLRELVALDLVDPSWVSVELRKPKHFQIQIKNSYKKTEIEQYAKNEGLTMSDNKDGRYLVIFKP
jgi:hypothetical protein